MKKEILQCGIIGTGRIAPRFLAEAKYVRGIHITAVYNPHETSARKFGEEHGLKCYYQELDEFLQELDVVYIAVPHQLHYEYARKCLVSGKHVLCEKPLAFTVREAKELYELAKDKNLILMEGIKTAHCPGFLQILDVANSGIIGEIKDVEACFSRITDASLREMTDSNYGGSFLEFGSYTLLPIVKLLGCQYESVEFDRILAENGVDIYTKVHVRYPNAFALSKTGLGVKSEGQLVIAGTKGYILAKAPWWLTKSFEVHFEDPNQVEKYSSEFLGDGLRYEIADLVANINGDKKENDCLTQEESIAIAGVMERFMKYRSSQSVDE